MTEPASHPDAAHERANTFPWPPVLLVVALTAPWLAGSALPISWPGLDDIPAQIIGDAFGIAGLALIVWAIVVLRRAGTTVMPDKKSTALVMSGPYSYFRNPIYLGDAMVLLSVAELTKNIWYVLAAVIGMRPSPEPRS